MFLSVGNEQCLYKVSHRIESITNCTRNHDCVFFYRNIYSCTTCCIFNHVKSMNKICRQVFKRTQLTAPNIDEYHYITEFSEKPSKQVTPTHTVYKLTQFTDGCSLAQDLGAHNEYRLGKTWLTNVMNIISRILSNTTKA